MSGLKGDKRRESSVVSKERTAGDGRIMTEGGACLTPADLVLDPAAGEKLKEVGEAAVLI